MDAQILFLKGKFKDSISVCKKLIETTTSTSVLIGAYYTVYFCATLSGLALEVSYAVTEIEKICESDVPYIEDYRLIYANLRFQLFLDPTNLHNINVMKLSKDAMTAYKLYIMHEIAISPSKLPPMAINMYCIFCRELELAGIFPALTFAEAALAAICSHSGDVNGEKYFIKQACKTCAENKSYSIISKWSNMSLNKYLNELKAYGISDKIAKLNKKNSLNYRIVYNALNKSPIFLDLSSEEAELLLLLSYNVSNKKIADVKNISEKEAAELVRHYCKKRNFKNKGELVKYAKNIANNFGKQKY